MSAKIARTAVLEIYRASWRLYLSGDVVLALHEKQKGPLS